MDPGENRQALEEIEEPPRRRVRLEESPRHPTPAPASRSTGFLGQVFEEYDSDETLNDIFNPDIDNRYEYDISTFRLGFRRNAIAEGSPVSPSSSDTSVSSLGSRQRYNIDDGSAIFRRMMEPGVDIIELPAPPPVVVPEVVEVNEVIENQEVEYAEDESGTDGSNCSICFDPFTNSGDHRVTCLKCGHLFGKNCIIKWLKTQPRCPQCNAKSHTNDVRVIFARNLVAVDTCERDKALEALEKEKAARRKVELDAACLKLKVEVESQRVKTLEDKLKKFKEGRVDKSPKLSPSKKLTFKEEKIFDIAKSQLRVGTYNKWHNMAVISLSTTNALYPNGCHGFKTIRLDNIDSGDLQFRETFLTFHKGAVRDLAFCPSQRETLLSVGMDKRAIVSSLNTMNPVQTIDEISQVWSCSWHHSNIHTFYTGCANGMVRGYDLRKPSQVLSEITIPGIQSPIVRILLVPPSTSNPAGYLIQRSNSLHFMDCQENLRILPFNSQLTSVAVDLETGHFLVSTRGSSAEDKHPTHHLATLELDNQDEIKVNILDSTQFPGSNNTLLTRSSIWSLVKPSCSKRPTKQRILMAIPEAKNIRIWDREEKIIPKIQHGDLTRDVFPITTDTRNFLGTITQNSFKVFSY